MEENIQSACAFQAVSCLRYLKLLSLQGKSIQLLSSWTCGIYSCSLWMEEEHTRLYVCTWFMRGSGPINIKTWKLTMAWSSHPISLACPALLPGKAGQSSRMPDAKRDCAIIVIWLYCICTHTSGIPHEATGTASRQSCWARGVMSWVNQWWVPLLFPLFIYTLALDCYFPHNKMVPAPLELSE